MATIKVKFRPSTVRGKAGVVCYQLCHRQENRQITTDMRIFPHWWNGEKRELVVTPDNEKTIFSYQKRINADLVAIRKIIRELDAVGDEYTLSDVIRRFRSPKTETGMLDYLRKEIGLLYYKRHARFSYKMSYYSYSLSFPIAISHICKPYRSLMR